MNHCTTYCCSSLLLPLLISVLILVLISVFQSENLFTFAIGEREFSINHQTTSDTSKIAPKIVDFKPQHQVMVGKKIKIFCYVEEGSKPFTFEWHKDNQALGLLSKYSSHSYEPLLIPSSSISLMTVSSDTSVLSIDPVIITDSGTYQCTVRNQIGSDKQSTRVTVKGSL